MQLRAIILLSMIAPVSTAGAAAPQPAQTQPTSKAKPARDPNEMVCEAQREPGSRLSMVKVCHTRAEWADLKAQDRQEIDLVQTRRSLDH